MLVPRTLRSKWFRDSDGVLTKVVDEDASYVEQIDLTDEMEEHHAITPSWDDQDGVTLGTPSASAGIVTFTHSGVGSVVFVALLDFVAYLASLIVSTWAHTPYHFYMSTGAGLGGAAGDPVMFTLLNGAVPVTTGLDGFVLRLVMPDGGFVVLEISSYNLGGWWDATLLEDAGATYDANGVGYVGDPSLLQRFATYEDVESHVEYTAKPTTTVRVDLCFLDPSNPTEDYA